MENEQSLNLESTTSEVASTEVTENSGSATASQEQDPEFTAEVESECNADSVSQPFLTVRYNHEDKPISMEEAVTLTQKGMAYDSLYPIVQRAAALKGLDVRSFIDEIEKSADEAYRAELVKKYGEDDTETVDNLMELYQSRKEENVKNREEQRSASLEQQFQKLKKEFPEIRDIGSLPPSVIKDFDGGVDLLSAYLRYRYFEEKRIKAARHNAFAASSASAGTLASNRVHESATEAFIKGLRR